MFTVNISNRLFMSTLVAVMTLFGLMAPMPSYSSDAGAFLGGMVTSRVLNNMSRRTNAEEQQAYNSSKSTQQAQPAATDSTEQKLAELDKLAAGGYISKEEYKAKRQSIIDSM